MSRSKSKKIARKQEKRKERKSIDRVDKRVSNSVCPKFDIEFLLNEECFGIPVDDINLLAEVFGKLDEVQGMKIGEAMRNGDLLLNYIPERFEKFCEYVRNRLNDVFEYNELFTEGGIWRCRFGGTLRVYAFRVDENEFKVVWIDPNHEIYPTEPA